MDLHGLPTDLEQFVQQEIAEGKYQSTEEVVSAALRLLQAHRAQSGNGRQSSNGYSDHTPRSADDILHAIFQALATGEHGPAIGIHTQEGLHDAAKSLQVELMQRQPLAEDAAFGQSVPDSFEVLDCI